MPSKPNDESASGNGIRWVLVLAVVVVGAVVAYFVVPLIAAGSPEHRLIECVRARDNADRFARWLNRCP